MRILEILSDDSDWNAETNRIEAVYSAKKKYEQLIADLSKIEEKTGLSLVDPNVDHENVQDGGNSDQESKEYWDDMYRSACYNAGMRAEESGQSINELLGKRIY